MTTATVLHWFDFICPFCYIAQDRNRILREGGVTVVELPMQIHPEIGPEGAPAPRRIGPLYEHLAAEGRDAGLPLNWSDRIPYSRFALAAAETVRAHDPDSHQAFSAATFHAYFALGLDIGDWAVITKCADEVGVDPFLFERPMTPGRAADELRYAEAQAREHHVSATPSWLVHDQLVAGLQPRAFFTALARALTG